MCENNNTWAEFEVWIDETSINGFMPTDEADEENPVRYYSYDGFECSDIQKTKYPNTDGDDEFKWEMLVNWMSETDLVQYLVDFAKEEKKLLFRTESDFGRIFDVELYINCSKIE